MNWFTSDTHYYHRNIIGFCDRPFDDEGHMNEAMIANWNERVGPDDTVYHLGDFLFGTTPKWVNIVSRLNGRIVLVKGNHDLKNLTTNTTAALFAEIHDDLYRRLPDASGQEWDVWMNHYPPEGTEDNDPRRMYRPNASGEFQIALCGHVHTAWKRCREVVNVGVDVWDFKPVSLDEIIAYLDDTDA